MAWDGWVHFETGTGVEVLQTGRNNVETGTGVEVLHTGGDGFETGTGAEALHMGRNAFHLEREYCVGKGKAWMDKHREDIHMGASMDEQHHKWMKDEGSHYTEDVTDNDVDCVGW